MGVGDDIKLAYQEVGIHYKVTRGLTPTTSGEYIGEYLMYEPNLQASKPFLRNFAVEASLPYDTVVISGDLLTLDDGQKFLVNVVTPDVLQGEAIEKLANLYKANVSGELYRYSGEAVDALYHTVQVFDLVASNVYATLAPEEMQTKLEQVDFAQLENKQLLLYLPNFYHAQVLDRYVPISGEYYKVRSVNRRMFDGVDILSLEEDTRE